MRVRLLIPRIASLGLVAFLVARPAGAMDVHVRGVGAASDTVAADVEITALVPDSLGKVIADGGTLHLRLQAELWESRPVWDRLVYPALVKVFRVVHSARGLVISADSATVAELDPASVPFRTRLTLGRADRVAAGGKYYVRLTATIGTIANRDIDDVNDAVFGREGDSGSAASVGRFILRSMLQLSDYLQSVTAETRGRKVSGVDILKRARP